MKTLTWLPNYVLGDVRMWYGVLGLVAALAALDQWELGKKADAFAPVPVGIGAEWYFRAMFHTLKLLPGHIVGIEGEHVGVIAFGLVAMFLVLVPFLDRRSSRGESSPWFTLIAILGLIYLVVFTIIGRYAT